MKTKEIAGTRTNVVINILKRIVNHFQHSASLTVSFALFGILNIIWRETKARLSTHATQKSKMAGLLVGVACVLSLAFVFAPNNVKNPE